MIIKKFSAPSMREAMYKVKKELGDDAIILKSEKVAKGGLFDFSETKFEYEVTAAIDKSPLKTAPKKALDSTTTPPVQNSVHANENLIAGYNQSTDPGIMRDIDSKFKMLDLKGDLKTIETKLDEVAKHIKYNEMPNLPDSLVPYYIKLKDNFVEEKIVKDLMMQLYMNFKGEDFQNRDLIESTIRKYIAEKLNIAGLESEKVYAGPKVIALVGPTGVGKTTTLAKMAFNEKFFGKKKVGLITADTYRIAAVDQLKTYSTITQIPLEIIYQPDQIRSALNKFSNYDVVLVDTAGRSQRNMNQLSELKKILYEGSILDVYLVLSITTRHEDQEDILKRFAGINYNRLIFTKLDETSGYGALLNASVHYQVPTAVLTYGQNVPDDIELAERDKIAGMIINPERVNFS